MAFGCFLVAAVLVLSGVVHLAILVVSGDSWSGPLSWRKPATFGLSFGLTLATITWISGFLPLSARARGRLLAGFATACTIEVVVITMQRWRGLPSHFIPTGSPGPLLNGIAGVGAAVGAAGLIVISVVLGVAAFRPNPDQPASMRLAVRAGMASFLLALAVGAVMLGRGLILTRTGDPDAAFAFSGGLKPGHAATMHGVLVLPLLARLLSRGGRDEAGRRGSAAGGAGGVGTALAVVRVACAGYLLFAGVVVLECAVGIDPWVPGTAVVPLVTTVLAVSGVLVLAAAGIVTLAGLTRRALRPVR